MEKQARKQQLENEKQQQIYELEKDFKAGPLSICLSDGAQDETLINTVNTGIYSDIKNILEKHRESISQDALNTCLIKASESGQKLVLILLIKSGANVNCSDQYGNTPLMACAQRGYYDMSRILITNKADVNKVNNVGDTALLLSITKFGSADMARLLVLGSNVNAKNNEGYTPLMKAVDVGDLEVIHILILNGADVTDSKGGETVLEKANKKGIHFFLNVFTDCKILKQPTLIAAVKYRDLNLIQTVLSYEDGCIDQGSSKGEAALEVFIDLILSEKKGLSPEDKRIINLLILKEYNARKISTPNKKNQRGAKKLPLVKAVQIGDVDIVKWLCIAGAQVNDSDITSKNTPLTNKWTPLMIAAKEGFFEIVELLLAKDADIEIKGAEGTALDLAMNHDHLDCAKLLIERKARNAKSEAFRLAIQYNNLTVFLHLISTFNKDMKNLRYLDWSILFNSENIFRILLDEKPDINQRFCRSHYNPKSPIPKSVCLLHITASYNHLQFTEMLLHNNADPNVTDSNGNTALFYANKDICNFLLRSGADVNVKNAKGQTAIFSAIENRMADVVEALLEAGALINLQDDSEETPMFKAIYTRNPEIIALLIKWNADTKTVLKGGHSYLTELLRHPPVFYYSHEARDTQIIQHLLATNIDINLENDDGNTALILACDIGLDDAVLLLLRHGADVNFVNKFGQTALSISLRENMDIVKILLTSNARFLSLLDCQQAVLFFINKDDADVIQLALGRGVYPFLVKSDYPGQRIFYKDYRYNDDDVSPLSLALQEGCHDIANFLIATRFLTGYDVTALIRTKEFQDFELTIEKSSDSIFHNLLSLYTLSFVRVSDLLGATPDRESRVDSLPLPQPIKQQLLHFLIKDIISSQTLPHCRHYLHRYYTITHNASLQTITHYRYYSSQTLIHQRRYLITDTTSSQTLITDTTSSQTLPHHKHYLITDTTSSQPIPHQRHYLITNTTSSQKRPHHRHYLITDTTSSKTLPHHRHYLITDTTSSQTLPHNRHYFITDTTSLQTLPHYRHYLITDTNSLQTLPHYRHYLITDTTSLQTLTHYRHYLITDTTSSQILPHYRHYLITGWLSGHTTSSVIETKHRHKLNRHKLNVDPSASQILPQHRLFLTTDKQTAS
ncbi:ankyrin repeat domain-containing protein 50 [Biomphalaria pfeifferi]|uniref:Ankyrin repeat domain-containing protein 50 n=1 Tax=Biomphalaria pfeifferi TaxID=112525 RepID=A0AAD8FIJ0_BIOPF|nr:ankyrin repeat domain-containing protein 50 [Biomphalaria pfeifferi]